MGSIAADPGTFEGGVSNWTVNAGALSQSSAQKHSGTYSLQVIASGSPPANTYPRPSSAAVPVTPGCPYDVTCWVRSTGTPNVAAAIDWLDSGYAYASTTAATPTALAANTWEQRTLTSAVAPAGAAYAIYGPTFSSVAGGSTLWVDDADILGVTITATEQAAYPVRMGVAVNGLTLGDDIDVYREVAGARTLVRGGSADSVVDTAFAVIDDELPFGVPIRYVAVVNDTAEYATAAASHTLVGGKVVLTDPITGLAAEVQILAADTATRTRDAARFRVAGRNVVVSQALAAPEGAYELFVETTTAYENLMTLLVAATEGIVQIRQPGGYDGVDAYLAVDSVSEKRWSQDGTDQRRRVTISWAEVEAWPADLQARGFTYGEVEAYYAGLTYADAEGEFTSYLRAKVADFS